MKKNALIIYIAMIVVGMVMLFVYIKRPAEVPVVQTPPPVAAPPQAPKEEIIRIAVAKRNLAANTVLTTEDYQIKSLSIPLDGAEKNQYSMPYASMKDFALRDSLNEGEYITVDALVEPGSTEYIAMFLTPGSVIYTFTLEAKDNYLLDNLKAGQGIDIYLSYGKKALNDGSQEIISPSQNIRDTRLQALMRDKRILALRSESIQESGLKRVATGKGSGNQLLVEMTSADVKLLKGLEGKAQLLLFPALNGGQSNVANDQPGVEAAWPISDAVIFDTAPLDFNTVEKPVKELRG